MAPKEFLSKPHPEVVSVLVGPDQREFVVHRKLLCESSSFFRDSIDAVPQGLTSPSSSPSSKTATAAPPRAPVTIWLASESPGVFELFVLWLYRRHGFRTIIDEAAAILATRSGPHECIGLSPPEASPPAATAPASPAAQACTTLHWNLVHLHLFAALTGIPALQDAAMDALQDLYLRFDWEATPGLIRFLYAECDAFTACRLRKWTVALLAWTLSNRDSGPAAAAASTATESAATEEDDDDSSAADTAFLRLLDALPPLRVDYDAHLAKMQASRADVRIKNPQLRIQSNHLRRSDRHFGFRQCSFHSHRRAVGEGRCPHILAAAHGRSGSESSERSERSGHSGHSGPSASISSGRSRMSAATAPRTPTPTASRPAVVYTTTTTTGAAGAAHKTTNKTVPVPATGRSPPSSRWSGVPPSRPSPGRSPTPSRPRAPDMAPLGMECTI